MAGRGRSAMLTCSPSGSRRRPLIPMSTAASPTATTRATAGSTVTPIGAAAPNHTRDATAAVTAPRPTPSSPPAVSTRRGSTARTAYSWPPVTPRSRPTAISPRRVAARWRPVSGIAMRPSTSSGTTTAGEVRVLSARAITATTPATTTVLRRSSGSRVARRAHTPRRVRFIRGRSGVGGTRRPCPSGRPDRDAGSGWPRPSLRAGSVRGRRPVRRVAGGPHLGA